MPLLGAVVRTASRWLPLPSDPVSSDLPPAGFRWVGIGQAVIAVPDAWPINAINCGTPTRDTVVVDLGVVNACAISYPANVTSVEIRRKNEMEPVGDWAPVKVDGEEALRSPADASKTFNDRRVYRASLYLPGRDVMFEASSSVSQEEADRLLARVAILDALVAVPGVSDANNDLNQSKAGETYVRTLEEAGFTVVERGQATPGFVLDVSPAPGTVVEPGSMVPVTVAG